MSIGLGIAALLQVLMASLGRPRNRSKQNRNLVEEDGAYTVGDFKDENGDLQAHLLVEEGTNQDDCVQASDASLALVGVVEYRVKDLEILPADETGTYDSDDILSVGAGGYRLLQASESISIDDFIVAAANGQARSYVDQSNTSPDDPAAICGKAVESASADGLFICDMNAGVQAS